jgi:N-glycosylase/DNA lyase
VDESPRLLRDRLLDLPGIGPKTASWIVRNHLDSDDVAIIDVHLHRACVMMNVFEAKSDPAKEYFSLEALFFCVLQRH